MTRAFAVRRARPEEYVRLGDLTVDAYLGLPGSGRYPEYLAELRDVASRAGQVEVLVAVDDDGHVLGGVTYVRGPGPWYEGHAEDEAEFRALAVAPDAQGLGIGTRLVQACIERARRDRRAALSLHTRPQMVAAQRIYERLGFVRMPDRDWEFDPGEWLLGYRLPLDPGTEAEGTAADPATTTRLGAYGSVVPRPAATVVLVRDRPDGAVEVLLSHRPSTMAFAPDVHVFPGGAVDPEDADPAIVARSRLGPEAAAERLGGAARPSEAIAFHIAGVRELFEEAGVLLAEPRASGGRSGAFAADALASARSALLRGETSFAEVCAGLDVDLRTDALVPLSRWVTPPIMARRYDARFFAARLPEGVEPSLEGEELLAHRWIRPGDALAALADGELRLWVPTAANLQRLVAAPSFEAITASLAAGRAEPPETWEVAPDIVRVRQGSAAGVDGIMTNAYVVGGRGVVVVDPADPSEEALLAIVEAVREADATIVAVALTSTEPEHSGGAEHLREGLGVLVHGSASGAVRLPIPVEPLTDGHAVPAGDVRLIALEAPGPRPDHLAFHVPSSGSVLCGDLLGPADRSIPPAPDVVAWRSSLALLRALGPRRLLPAHDEPVEGEAAVEAAIRAAEDRLGTLA